VTIGDVFISGYVNVNVNINLFSTR